jgi:hypothetical protein
MEHTSLLVRTFLAISKSRRPRQGQLLFFIGEMVNTPRGDVNLLPVGHLGSPSKLPNNNEGVSDGFLLRFVAPAVRYCVSSKLIPPGGATMTADESKALKKDTRVYWRGDAVDSGMVTEASWDAVTIAWNNGRWPECTAETCVKFNKHRPSHAPCHAG